MKPTKFVNLHVHTTFSAHDGLGYPDEHFKYVIENGMDACALTEHGNMNSHAHAALWVKDWNKEHAEGKLKYLPGIEAYFHPDLAEWRRLKDQKKLGAEQLDLLKHETHVNVEERIVDGEDDGQNVGNQLVLENEEESKTTGRSLNPLNRRHHLVMLAKDSEGLQRLFAIVSRSYIDGFYRFPRVDPVMLNATTVIDGRSVSVKGHVVALTACIAGPLAYEVFNTLGDVSWDDLSQGLLDDEQRLDTAVTAAHAAFRSLESMFGDDLYLEMQFNRLPQQHLVNRVILELARRFGLTDRLVVTCDVHYPRPELWRDREIYKKLGYLNYESYNADSLPKDRSELMCELYPKNAEQVWQSYKDTTVGMSFYDDALVCAAIERTYTVAHEVIGEPKNDMSIKLPKKIIPVDKTAIEHLVDLCKVGMYRRGLAGKVEYIKRLKEELEVIKYLDIAEYFVTIQKIMDLAREVTLTGPARGSGGGSLVNYVLYVTELDPIRWNLPFSRFLSKYRKGMADIDCVHEQHLVLMGDRSYKCVRDIVVGDQIIGGDDKSHVVTATYIRPLRRHESAVWVRVLTQQGLYGHLVVVPMHKFVRCDGSVVRCKDLHVGDGLMSPMCNVNVVAMTHGGWNSSIGSYVDVTVEDDHRFHIVPFDVLIDDETGDIKHTIGYVTSH